LIHFDPAIVPSGDAPSGWARGGPGKPQPRIAAHEAHGEGCWIKGRLPPGNPIITRWIWTDSVFRPDLRKDAKGVWWLARGTNRGYALDQKGSSDNEQDEIARRGTPKLGQRE
jgi:hypothetical protein